MEVCRAASPADSGVGRETCLPGFGPATLKDACRDGEGARAGVRAISDRQDRVLALAIKRRDAGAAGFF
jgi:hypothetical protein